MRIFQLVFLFVALLLMGSTGFVIAQNNDPPIIDNPLTEAVQYCDEPVAVASEISITNIQVDEANEGMKISISPYMQGEDILEWEEVGTFNYSWNSGTGFLEISGIGSDAEYEEAVSKVYYKNIAATATTGIRSFSISLIDADYLPATDHFYRFVARESISWSSARALAASMDYYGLQGYLATIRSKVEQDFIYTKTEGTGWIGASDEDEEGTWKWVEGPDDGVIFWKGNYSGDPVGGEYSNWGSGEPNNLNNEDYAHILYSVGVRGDWNDLPNPGSDVEGYIPQGFLIEFGGMPGDPEVKLSAVARVEVSDSKKPEFDENVVKTLFCGGTTHQFTLAFTNGNPSVNLSPLDDAVTVDDKNSYNPTITVPEYGKYRFTLEMVDDASCEYIDTIEIGIHNQPDATFNLDSNECYGYNLQLSYTGFNVEETEFTWYYNSEVFASETGLDSITIPLGFDDIQRTVGLKVNEQGCIATSAPQDVKVKPDIIVSAENTEGCSPLAVKFYASTNKPAQSYSWDFSDGRTSSEQNPLNTFLNPGDLLQSFDISLRVLDIKGCENTAVYDSLVHVYPVPTANFDFYPAEVLITDPEVSFTNTSHAASLYHWDFGDSTVTDENNPVHRYGAMDVYPVKLEVANDFECTDTIIKEVTVTFDQLFPPNAFSPNALLTEDREFRIYGEGVLEEGYQLLIFNRWGEVIFESDSQNEGWDGKMKNGSFAPTGVYTWVIQYTDFTGEKHKQQGNVTLLL